MTTPIAAMTRPSRRTSVRMLLRLSAKRHSDSELACAPTDGKCQYAGHAYDGDQQGNGGESSKDDRVEFVGRKHFGANIGQRVGPLTG